jgi:tetratricopeptide (TPR) repeat protein
MKALYQIIQWAKGLAALFNETRGFRDLSPLKPIGWGLLGLIGIFFAIYVFNKLQAGWLVWRGERRYSKGHFEQAVDSYDQAIRKRPSYAKAYFNRGLARQALGHADLANADFNRAQQIAFGYQPEANPDVESHH